MISLCFRNEDNLLIEVLNRLIFFRNQGSDNLYESQNRMSILSVSKNFYVYLRNPLEDFIHI